VSGNFPVVRPTSDSPPDPYDLADPETGDPLGPPAADRRFCNALECRTELPDDETQRRSGLNLYVCRAHYYRLSWALRNAIKESYHRVTDPDWRPTLEFCDAAEATIRLLARKDKVPVTGSEPVLRELARVREAIKGGKS
jgi:hypothetical protein